MGDIAEIYVPAAPSSYLTCSVQERQCLVPGDSSGWKQTQAGDVGGRLSPTLSLPMIKGDLKGFLQHTDFYKGRCSRLYTRRNGGPIPLLDICIFEILTFYNLGISFLLSSIFCSPCSSSSHSLLWDRVSQCTSS